MKNILGLLFLVAILVYSIFGDPDNASWGSFYFITWNSLMLYFGDMCLKSQRDKFTRIVIKSIMGITLVKVLLNIVSVIDLKFYNSINRGWEIGITIACLVLIFLIYNYGRLVKK